MAGVGWWVTGEMSLRKEERERVEKGREREG